MVNAQALWITGTVGVGKTSVAEAAGDLLAERRVPSAVIDVDWLRRSWPPPPGDRFNEEMAQRNLKPVAANYLGVGTLRIVLAGVLESRTDRDHFQEALRMPMAVCRLKVDLRVVRARLARRHVADDATLRWHLERSGELEAVLDASAVEDCCVDGTSATLAETAAKVLRAVGWTANQPGWPRRS